MATCKLGMLCSLQRRSCGWVRGKWGVAEQNATKKKSEYDQIKEVQGSKYFSDHRSVCSARTSCSKNEYPCHLARPAAPASNYRTRKQYTISIGTAIQTCETTVTGLI